MIHQTTITYTRPTIRRAAIADLRQSITWRTFAALGLCIGVSLVLFLAGNRSWQLGVFCTLAFILPALIVAGYVIRVRRSLAVLDRMPSKSAQFKFTEDGFTMTSDLGRSELSWRFIVQVRRCPELWLLYTAKSGYLTLPLASIDPVARDFILERIAAQGGRIM